MSGPSDDELQNLQTNLSGSGRNSGSEGVSVLAGGLGYVHRLVGAADQFVGGLIEDRHHPIDQGFQELRTALQHASTNDPGPILDHVLASNVGPQPRTDDVAMICLTNDVSAPAEQTARTA